MQSFPALAAAKGPNEQNQQGEAYFREAKGTSLQAEPCARRRDAHNGQRMRHASSPIHTCFIPAIPVQIKPEIPWIKFSCLRYSELWLLCNAGMGVVVAQQHQTFTLHPSAQLKESFPQLILVPKALLFLTSNTRPMS